MLAELRSSSLATIAIAIAIAVAALGCNPEVVEAEDAGNESESESGDECVVGSLDCACTPGGGCDPGLECTAGICIEAIDETETGSCSALGCACVDDPDCDDGLVCTEGACAEDTCGDLVLDPGEDCDDGNLIAGDGCDNDCSLTQILELSLGSVHTCALIEGGRIRCWGHNGAGQTGYGANQNIGDDESPRVAGDLPLPAAVDIAAGGVHTCAVLENGDVRCWGFNSSGQLGLGNSLMVPALGDDETLEGLQSIDLVAPVNGLGTGVLQTCVRLSGQLRCWGAGTYGQLGLGNVSTIGDDELPLDVPAVMLGSEPIDVYVGGAHGCAVMVGGGLRCWGRNDSGQLGLGMSAHVGDNEDPVDVPEVNLIPPSLPERTTVVSVGLGLVHTCALLSSGDVLCWGASLAGQIGQGNPNAWGNDANESPSALTPVQLGGSALALAVGYQHSCALLEGGDIRCWGNGESGQLGYGDELPVGLFDLPADRDPVELGAPAVHVACGAVHTCAVLDDQGVICWGNNEYGQLGYGFTHTIGDDELPEVAGVIDLL